MFVDGSGSGCSFSLSCLVGLLLLLRRTRRLVYFAPVFLCPSFSWRSPVCLFPFSFVWASALQLQSPENRNARFWELLSSLEVLQMALLLFVTPTVGSMNFVPIWKWFLRMAFWLGSKHSVCVEKCSLQMYSVQPFWENRQAIPQSTRWLCRRSQVQVAAEGSPLCSAVFKILEATCAFWNPCPWQAQRSDIHRRAVWAFRCFLLSKWKLMKFKKKQVIFEAETLAAVIAFQIWLSKFCKQTMRAVCWQWGYQVFSVAWSFR